ncbi:hypothetical protein [Streptomyces sp. SLBN-118]|uniref:hypothetical protein n=1 Tax=Streptomyces sp. SLBN-118 TaxID=2768454 RepID=UPI0021B18D18|nr:hypothetical protein [Streptomyces sp. SLBN-118]
MAGLAVIAACAWAGGRHPRKLLGLSYDAAWYASVARDGYGRVVRSQLGISHTDLAFFPLFPGLERAASAVLPISLVSAGLLVAWLSAGAASWGIYAVGAHVYGRRVGTCLVILWALLPHAVVQTMAYTESLMTALAAWSLYAALTNRWIWSGCLALLAGLARPNGVAVAAAVICTAVAALWSRPQTRRNPRVWAVLPLAPLGWLGYVAWVGMRSGNPLGYFEVQREWGSRFDFGRHAMAFTGQLIFKGGRLSEYVVAAVLAVALIALVLLILDRPPLPLLVYTGVLVVIAFGGANYFVVKPRLLLPAFPLLLPAAMAMSKARLRTGAVLGAGLAAFSLTYGVYLLMFAPSAP